MFKNKQCHLSVWMSIGIILGLLGMVVYADWPVDPAVNVPICTAVDAQRHPQLVSDGAGGAIAVWYDWRDRDKAGTDIYAQRVNANGEVLWAANGISVCSVAKNQMHPTAVSDGAGGVIIAWRDHRNMAETWQDIYAQRVDANGKLLWQAEGVPICTAPNHQRFPEAISDGVGGAIITWFDARNEEPKPNIEIKTWDIYAQRVDGSGNTLWAQNGIPVAVEKGGQQHPVMCADGKGGAIIAWWDTRNLEQSAADVYAQRIDADGKVLWAANSVPVAVAKWNQWYPVMISDGAGGAIIVWRDDRASGRPGDMDVYAQRVDANGKALWTPNGIPIAVADRAQFHPVLATDGTNGAIIAWSDARAKTETGNDVYAQRVDGNGKVLWAANGSPISMAPNNQSYPAIVSDRTGGAIIAWSDERDKAATSADVYAQRVDSSGKMLWDANAIPIATAAGTQWPPLLESDEKRGVIAAWLDQRNEATTKTDLYAQRIDLDGSLGTK